MTASKDNGPLYIAVHEFLSQNGQKSIQEVAESLSLDKARANIALNQLVKMKAAERPSRGIYKAVTPPDGFGTRRYVSGPEAGKPSVARGTLLKCLADGPLAFAAIKKVFLDVGLDEERARRTAAASLVDARKRGLVVAIGTRGSFRYGLAPKSGEAAA